MTDRNGAARDGSLSPGTRVDGWVVGERIGAGAMGAVYEATDVALGRRVALKVLRRAFADDPAAIARFEREARAASRVEHPGIVDVIAIGALSDGRPFLVMSLLRGRSLRAELTERGPLPIGEAWAIVRQITLAVAAAHDAGVVHRDLKPDNVFLERADDAPPRARVLDFGLARLLPTADAPIDAGEGKLTQTGVPMGTPPYMAPEQWWGTDVGPAADQYAIAAMLFELVTGRPPFVSDKVVEIVQRHLHDPPPRLADRGVDAPPAFEALVARALAKTQSERFASLRDLVAAGDAALVHETASAAPAAALVATQPSVETAIPATRAQVEAPAPARSLLFVAAASLALGLAALCAVGYAGPARWNPRAWMWIAGYGSWSALLAALAAGFVVLQRASRSRPTPPPLRARTLLLCLLPALLGALGTYSGWRLIVARVPGWPETERLTTFDTGLWEAGAGRFIGFGLAAVLLATLAIVSAIRAGAPVLSRRESLAMAAGTAALASAATVAGAASAAWLGVVALALLLVPAAGPPSSADDELARSVAAAMAAILAAMVGLARVEGRAAIHWDATPTRAARVAEIVATAAERDVTVPVVAVLVVIVLATLSLRLLRLRERGLPIAPTRGIIALVLLVLAGAGVDALLHARVAEARRELRVGLSKQFVLFGKLDPPTASGLSGRRFAPHRAPALQLTTTTVAVDGEPTARVRALDSEAGSLALVGELLQALARDSEQGSGAPDLSLAVDRRVPWSVLSRILGIAYAAGARRVEVLLTRGRPSRIPSRAPAEAAHVLPKDFVALRAELVRSAEGAAGPDDDEPFAEVAADWVRRARSARGLRIGVR